MMLWCPMVCYARSRPAASTGTRRMRSPASGGVGMGGGWVEGWRVWGRHRRVARGIAVAFKAQRRGEARWAAVRAWLILATPHEPVGSGSEPWHE